MNVNFPTIFTYLKNNWSIWLFWIIAILFWQLTAISGLLNQAFLASPGQIATVFGRVEFWQLFGLDALATFGRLTTGLILSYLFSNLIVAIMLLTRSWKLINSLNKLLKYIPPPVIIPLTVLVVGINEWTFLAITVFVTTLHYLDYQLNTIAKEELIYQRLQQSWRVNTINRFRHFVFPITNFLNYRTWSSTLLWSIGVLLFAEIILGGKFGIGVRLINFQQLYRVDFLFGYIFLLVFFTFLIEKILIGFFANFRFNFVKSICLICLIGLILVSGFWYGQSIVTQIQKEPGQTIITYRAVANLPIFVMAEKFNSLNLELEKTGSGLQVMDSLQANKAAAGGYSDIPNVISGIAKNQQLKIISQVIEKPDQPALFLLSRKNIQFNQSWTALNNTKVGYYPNNQIIQQGLDFVLFQKGVRTSTIEFISGNDPSILSQSLASGQIDSLITIEPFASDLEKQLGLKRVNPVDTVIAGVNFKELPLAALTVNQNQLSQEQIKTLIKDIGRSIEFINANQTLGHQATGELIDILKKYDLNPESLLPTFQSSSSIDTSNLDLVISLIKLYVGDDATNNSNLQSSDYYYQGE